MTSAQPFWSDGVGKKEPPKIPYSIFFTNRLTKITETGSGQKLNLNSPNSDDEKRLNGPNATRNRDEARRPSAKRRIEAVCLSPVFYCWGSEASAWQDYV